MRRHVCSISGGVDLISITRLYCSCNSYHVKLVYWGCQLVQNADFDPYTSYHNITIQLTLISYNKKRENAKKREREQMCDVFTWHIYLFVLLLDEEPLLQYIHLVHRHTRLSLRAP